ncbi:hypothetical protein H7I53_08565 [Mycolicibacterium pulveris]|uniref:Lipoprotein LpqE n=1 Tax=Mycolicibacterium pulveris TaxID=36813 RepID=A0A7I7UKM3_MYCPV|nr:hypothetical protein [Mycolicibacterium pulveris]MCV6980273.1 hypothetical protein [Mycolicibacterium pulveris]BBY81660.1 hypothetical protein MPUL_28180 [Mycolicibacterium pulveris]
MDRFKMAACGLAAAVLVGGALSGCGAGQVSQTAMQEPGVNGTSANIGDVALRNIHLQVIQSSDFVQPGTDVELMFQASNQSRENDDKLVSIDSEVGSVTLTGDTTLPAGGVLIVGAPDGQITPLESVEAAEAAEAKVSLTKPITNGLTYEFTFTFEKAGEGKVQVPLSAGEAPRREAVQNTGGAGGHSGGH